MSQIKQLVRQVSVAADLVKPPPDGITILIYHRVGGGSDSAVDLDADVFERQLEMLAEDHRVLSLDDAVTELAATQPIGWSTNGAQATLKPGVVVTFDDGTTDFGEVVVPALERHHIPATLFAATHFVDTGEPFPWGAPPVSWSALADALTTGLIAVGSHTHRHGLLDRLPPGEVDEELDRSIELIGEHLGVAPGHFAYPKAVLGTPAAEVSVRRRFVSAALARNRVNRPAHRPPPPVAHADPARRRP